MALSSNSSVECHDSMTALSSAEPGRPIDWRMPSRSQGPGGCIRCSIGVMDQPVQVGAAAPLPGPQGLLQGIEDQAGPHGNGSPPAQDPPGVSVDDERDIDHAGPGRDVGVVGNPEPVRRGWAGAS